METTKKSSALSRKKRKYDPRPISFVEKFNFLKAVILSPDLTALDHKICLIISERYKDSFGNSETSLTYLEAGTGASHQGVVKSLKRLKEHNAIVIDEDRAGSRSTRYRPNLKFAASTPELTSTSQPALTSGSSQPALTSRGQPELTSRGSSGEPELTESHLRNPLTAEVTLSGQNTPAAGAGLSAAPREGVDRMVVKVASADPDNDQNGDRVLNVEFDVPVDEWTWGDKFVLESDDIDRQTAGRKRWDKFMLAIDAEINHYDDLVGKSVVLIDDRRRANYDYAMINPPAWQI